MELPNSFFPCTARLWNSLPIECFPLSYDLNGSKSGINKHLLPVGSFWRDLCMLLSFCDSFSYSSMPCSGCSALHRVNPNLNKEKKMNIKTLKGYFCFKTTSQYVSSEALHWLTIFYFVEKLCSVLKIFQFSYF